MLPIPEIVLLMLTLLLSFGITYFYMHFAVKKSVLDIPCERSSHEKPTPCGGGIAFVITFYALLFYSYLNGKTEKELFLALLPGMGLSVIGLVDDYRKLSPALRIVVQFFCSGISLFFLKGFNFYNSEILLWFGTFIALFGYVWFINLFNFLDGSDGYASMEAIAVSLALWYFTGMNMLLLLAFAVGGFLYWNLPKAKIFMGDAGSTTLGFVLAVFGVYFHNHGSLNFIFWLILTSLFWFDATVTIIRRIIKREKLSQPHKNHMYQRAIQSGFSHLQAMLLGLGINVILFIIGILIWKEYFSYFPGLLLMLFILSVSLKFVDKKFANMKQTYQH